MERSQDNTYAPVNTDGTVYIYDGDELIAFKVILTEECDDLPLITEDSIIASIIAA